MRKSVFESVLVAILVTLNYNAFAADESATIIGKNIFGLVEDVDHDPLVIDERAVIHNTPNDVIKVKYDKTTFEAAAFNQDIGAIYLTKLDPDLTQKINTLPLDTAPVNGITRPVRGSASAWGSVLYSESSAIDAAEPANFVGQFKFYFKGQADKVNAYEYGWPMELVLLDNNGDSKLIKHYAMGRVAASQMVVMPDQKTVLMLSGGERGYLFAFVADDPKNLSQGTLWVANVEGNKVSFVKLASTSTLKAKFKMRRAEFSKLISKELPENDNCEGEHKAVTTIYGLECLEIKDQRYAGLFEPHRVAAASGVAASFKNYEQISFDANNKILNLKSRSGQQRRFKVGSVSASQSDYLPKELL